MAEDRDETDPTSGGADTRSVGERKLFEALVRDHSELLYVYITSCVGRTSLADEVHQDTLLTAWRRLHDFDQTRSFGAWIRGIARIQIRAHVRQNAAQLVLSEELLDGLEARFHALSRQPGDTLDDKLDCLRECLHTSECQAQQLAWSPRLSDPPPSRGRKRATGRKNLFL
jgi:RNA polymerase sigma factor (sigma-70 family)